VAPQSLDLQPPSARFQPSIFPDNPLVLEGLDLLYLNSEKASELKDSQISALYAWLNAGGHLVVAVEQVADVTAARWLRNLFPFDLKDMQTVASHSELQNWIRMATTKRSARAGLRPSNVPDRSRPGTRTVAPEQPFSEILLDPVFEAAPLQVASGTVRDGTVMLSAGEVPLMVTANRGRGRITALLFSPEREPFRSWKNRDWFWAKLISVPPTWFVPEPLYSFGGTSIDGIFGAMIDSRQVRKLPVQWLLLLLVVYLLVIGPLDQYCLKRLNRQMLTWLTFPIYVALFSLLIYYIGYKLRAGETEWNELHLVDILPHGEAAEWRGRTYASVYSPVNARYKVAGDQLESTLRGEFMSAWSGGQEGSRAEVLQRDRGFDAEIFVPVWTSQLFVSDWMQSGEYPFTVSVAAQPAPTGDKWVVTIENRLGRELKEIRLVLRDRVYDLGTLPPGKTSTFSVAQGGGTALNEFVQSNTSQFVVAAQGRQHAFGDNAARWLELNAAHLTAVSFVGKAMNVGPNQRGFVCPGGLDLTPLVDRGDAVVLAWDPGHAPGDGSMNRFKTVRNHRDTLLRLAVPVGQSKM